MPSLETAFARRASGFDTPPFPKFTMSNEACRQSAPRILIVRLSAVGDVIHGLPVLNALRGALPDAFLAWAVEDRAAAMLRGHPALDELIVLPRGFLKSPGQVWQLRRRLHELRFDTAIDLQGLAKSAIVARLSGAPRRIGFGDEKGRELSRWLNNDLVRPHSAHIIDCNLELLEPLGIQPPPARFEIPESAADAAAAMEIIRQQRLQAGFGIINPGAGWPSKLWPAERFAAVAAYLGRVERLPTLVVWAGERENAWARQIVTGSEGHAREAPRTSLCELAALCRRAVLFVGSDTGPLHLAAAVGTACVGMYGPMSAQRNGPYGSQHVALQEMTFQGRSRQRKKAPATLMEAIGVELVCEACSWILRRDGWQAAA
jgi:lipopolysaccharide heptosyltransferase I